MKEEFTSFCKKLGIVRHRTCAGRPQQNGMAERMNRTLLEKARCMLFHAKLSKGFWTEAVKMAAFLANRSPNTALGLKTTEEVWSRSPVDYSGIRICGCPAYAYVNDGKLEPRAKKCVFLGYTDGIKGFRLWDPSTSRIITSRDVTFNESVFLHVESSNKVASEKVENDDGKDTQREVVNDVLDDVEMMTPQAGGDVPSTSSSRKATTPRK